MSDKNVRIVVLGGRIVIAAKSLSNGASYSLEVDGKPFSSIDNDPGKLNASRLSGFFAQCSIQLEKRLSADDVDFGKLQEEIASAIKQEFAT
jgi:hypothetical protein